MRTYTNGGAGVRPLTGVVLRPYGRQVPPDRVSDLIPFVHVADPERSAAFYRFLGFEVRDSYHHEGKLDWVFLERSNARLMLARASAPIDPAAQAVLFYLYARDLDALRAHLIAGGVGAGKIVDGRPGPRREFRLSDPDGYCLIVAEGEPNRVREEPA